MRTQIGDEFGRLTVHAYSHSVVTDGEGKGRTCHYWICKCSCGNLTRPLRESDLKRKPRGTKSCGCIRREYSGYHYTMNPLEKIGDVHGDWEVKELVGRKTYPNIKSSYYVFRCECRYCHKSRNVLSANLIPLRSCACQRPQPKPKIRFQRVKKVKPPREPRPIVLTDLQTIVLGYVNQGLGRRRIAARMGVSVDTVKDHIAAIRRKGLLTAPALPQGDAPHHEIRRDNGADQSGQHVHEGDARPGG